MQPSPKGETTSQPEPTDEDLMLYVQGIIPPATLRDIADKIVLIRKSLKFGTVFLEIGKSKIEWIGFTMKNRPPE